jgi:CheY-like chemotaxis protein/HPt (histidine-containing phosphotransfer) domain-containing protein
MEYYAFNLRECIEETLNLLASKAATKNLNLTYEMDEPTPEMVMGDSARVRQVLVNLVNNAIKFTHAGEVVVSVGGRAPEVYLSVRDTGIGIPSDRLDRLFQPFSQVDASTSRTYGGTGLGLAICHRLVSMMGGTIRVESEVGRGTTFHVTFATEAVPSPPQPFRSPDQPVLAGKRVLLVDDNATNRTILSRQLRRWGMHAVEAGSPAEALALIRQGPPFDLAILDMRMPEMDGMTLAMTIHTRHDPASLPIMICASVSVQSEAYRSGKAQIAAVLVRPVRVALLHETLVRMVQGQPLPSRRVNGTEVGDRQMGAHYPLNILLAEDSMVNQKVALHMLDKLGYRADTAANGHEVLAALNRRCYDVILMDVQMPEMDGIEATQRIRAEHPPDRQPWIVAMTAHTLQGDREWCLSAGMDDYIGKPARLDDLAEKLRHAAIRTQRPPFSSCCKNHPPPSPPLGPSPLPSCSDVDSPIDDDAYASFLDIAGEATPQLVALFLSDTGEKLVAMRQSHVRGDTPMLTRLSHALKSNSAQFGALPLSSLCRDLEMQARAGELRGGRELLARIDAEFARVRQAMEGRAREYTEG